MSTSVDQLYEIWYVGTRTYRLQDVLTVLRLYRNEVVSNNHAKLQKVCDRLNVTKSDDEHYEIRPVAEPRPI